MVFNTAILPHKGRRGASTPSEPNIWQFMRDNWLSNTIFETYEEIIEHCCKAWRKLIADLWNIASIGLRDWAHRY